MSDAERDPHVLVSARASHHEKLVELPNDRARWGWIVLLGAAKLRRPPGEFASRAVLCADLAWYGRFLDDYLKVGLVHLSPVTCAHCLERMPEWASRKAGTVVVHDWHRHQRTSTKKVREWRSENDIGSGHETLGKRTGNPGETDGKPFPSRAHSLSLSESSSYDGEGGAGGEDDEPEFPVLQWLSAHGCYQRPGNGYHQKIILAVERHPASELVAAMERLSKAGVRDGDIKGLLFGAIDALDAASRPNLRALEAEEGSAERAAIRSRRIDEQMWARRREQFRWTGEWHEEWGPKPEEVQA